MANKLNRWLKEHFASYIVSDELGTLQLEWTEKAAVAWLPYCYRWATVHDRYGQLVAQRVQRS